MFAKFHFSAKYTGLGTDIFIKLEYIARSLVKIKSIPDWHLFISRMERKWTKWHAMTSHLIAYRSLELLFGTHTFHFNCFFEDFNCVFTQIRCLSRVLVVGTQRNRLIETVLFEHPKHIFKPMGKKIIAILCSNLFYLWTIVYLYLY